VVAKWLLTIQEIKDDAATISAGAVILSRYQNVYPAVMPIAYYPNQPEITIVSSVCVYANSTYFISKSRYESHESSREWQESDRLSRNE